MLNKAGGNMFPFVDYTWNPQSGCLHDCKYCYALKMPFPYDMTPGFRDHLMKDDLYKFGERVCIFVTDMGDLFGEWVPKENINQILDKCLVFPKNRHVLLTKNPDRLLEFFGPGKPFSGCVTNFILGTTIETNFSSEWYSQFSKAPPPMARVYPMIALSRMGYKTLVSIEPILDFDLTGLVSLVEMIRAMSPQIVAVGADSKKCGLPEPHPEEVMNLIFKLREFVPHIVIKSNLKRLLGPEKLEIASEMCPKYQFPEPHLPLPGDFFETSVQE